MIRHIIWDVDGTLFDTYPAFARALHRAAREQGVAVTIEQALSLTQVSLAHAVTTVAREHDVDQSALAAGFWQRYQQVPAAEQPPFPDVESVLRIIRQRGHNLIATHRQRATTLDLLETHNLRHYFDDVTRTIVAGDDGFARKPDAAGFEAMIARNQLDRRVTLAVGDRDLDILAGQAVGVHTCRFGNQTGDAEADLAIADYRELQDYLREQPPPRT